jgi:hypothetical protein
MNGNRVDTETQLNMSAAINTEIKSVSLATQNSICYTELHVSADLRPSSGSQLVFKTHNIM